ncbi:hypothetical protein [Nocardia sp. NPDC058480]|uniref:hypothetical protein n=1 Tax=unclassified Nocardia TaxID=2637762 RepID=UPI00364C0472
MSDSELVFFYTDNSPELEAEIVGELLGGYAGKVEDGARVRVWFAPDPKFGEVFGDFFRNSYSYPDDVEATPEAIDAYSVVLGVRCTERRAQKECGRQVFDSVNMARPDVPLILTNGLDLLVAAYLPGRGIRDFSEGVTVYSDYERVWRPWVVSRKD